MLRRRVVLVLALAMVMGLLTAYVVYRSVSRPVVQQAEMVQVVVAKTNVSLGEALTPNHIVLTPWPKATLPQGAVLTLKDAEGRLARTAMFAGEPILESKLAPAGQGGLMPVLVPKGKRAVSIIVDQAVQRSGFVVPNSRVDVLVTMAGGSGGDRKSRIVLQDVTILAADQTVEMKDNKPVTMTTVTMALSPEETERLTLAQSEGKVALALRNVQDTAQISTPGVTAAQLMGGPTPPSSTAAKKATPAAPSAATRASGPARTAAPKVQPAPAVQAPVPAPPPPTHTVLIIRGTAVSEQTYLQDSGGGWTEGTKADATKKSR